MPSNMAVLSHKTIPAKVYSMLESFTIWDFRYFDTNFVNGWSP
jgi:hypothetical protein